MRCQRWGRDLRPWCFVGRGCLSAHALKDGRRWHHCHAQAQHRTLAARRRRFHIWRRRRGSGHTAPAMAPRRRRFRVWRRRRRLATRAPTKMPTYNSKQLASMDKAWPSLLQHDMEGTLPKAQLRKVEQQAAAVRAQLGKYDDASSLYGIAEMIGDLEKKS